MSRGFNKLKQRWNLSSMADVWIVLLVFALTGTTILLLKKPLLSLFVENGEVPTIVTITYYILVLPIYNLVLLLYGALLGKFQFFWEFEKKTFRRIMGRKDKKK